MRIRNKLIQGWILVALFLFGQVSVLTHESTHKIHSVDDYCIVCLNATVFHGAIPASALNITVKNIAERLDNTVFCQHPLLFVVTAQPRAPPYYS